MIEKAPFDKIRRIFRKDGIKPEPENGSPTGVSRRTMLRGAAAMVASPEKTGQAVVSGALNISSGTAEQAAAGLIPYAKLNLLFGKTDSDHGEVRKMRNEEQRDLELLSKYLSEPDFTLPDREMALTVSDAFGYLDGMRSIFTSSVKLGDMENPEIVTAAYKLAGAVDGEDSGRENLAAFARIVQKASGLPSSATLADVADVLAGKQRNYATFILEHIDEFPDILDRKSILQHVRLGLRGESPEDATVITRMLEKEAGFGPAYREALKKQGAAKEADAIKEWNESLESRGEIYCDISRVYSSDRNAGKNQSFRFKPVGHTRGSERGITRMHIEHYRQSIYEKAGRAGDFVPAESIVHENVESPADGIVIDTSDSLLIAILEKALKHGGRIQIPDRLQAVAQRNLT